MNEYKMEHGYTKKMAVHVKNNIQEIVGIPDGAHLISCKWVYIINYKLGGTIERYKAHLIAKGFSKKYGTDYLEIFSHVAKMNSVRVILAIIVIKFQMLYQLDIKNIFLNGEFEEVYMCMLPGYEKIAKYYILKEALFGLK